MIGSRQPGLLSAEDTLRNFEAAPAEAEARAALDLLIEQHAAPVVRRVVCSRLRERYPQDGQDVVADVLVEVLSGFEVRRRHGACPPILNVAAYVAAAAQHGCDRYFRARAPERHRLKNRVRYLLDHTPGFSIWSDADGATVAGRSDWAGASAAQVDLPALAPQLAGDRPAALLESVFSRTGAAMALDDLVELAARLWGVGPVMVPFETAERIAAAPAPAADLLTIWRAELVRLWGEIAALPRNQLVALLLHLRDEQGRAALPLIPMLGLAGVRELSRLLDLPLDELARFWRELPLDDLRIAARLGLTRQQVINLRKSARQRLVRRTREGAQ